jgi:beta propeller repeat protein
VSGDHVVFSDVSTGINHLRLWHRPTGRVYQVTSGPAGQILGDIDGNRIVYTDDRHGDFEIYLFEFSIPPPNEPPAIGCPSDLSAEATGATGAAVTFEATAADPEDGPLTPACAPAPGSLFPLGATTVTCTAADTGGLSATASFVVTVVDTTPPVLTLPADMTAEAPDASGAVVTFAAGAADLVDGTVGVACTPASGSTFPVGATTVACSAGDAAGNTATGSFTVTVAASLDGRMTGAGRLEASGWGVVFAFGVRDREPRGERGHLLVAFDRPVPTRGFDRFHATTVTSVTFSDDPASAPGHRPAPAADTVVFAGEGRWNGQPGYRYEVRAVDRGEPGRGRDAFAIAVWSPAGTVVASVDGVLAGGNIQSHRLHGAHPPDVTAPRLWLPGDLVKEADGPAGARVHYTVTARDDVDRRVDVDCTPASGVTFPLAVTPVTCVASDEAGNVATGSFSVTVGDSRAPRLDLPKWLVVRASSAAGAVVNFAAAAHDAVSGAVAVTCAPASGSEFPPGLTRVHCSAADLAGNVGRDSFTVTVKPGVTGGKKGR